MKISRSPDDICLLCRNNKADKKGSHYTPAGLIKREIGKRDYEEIYSINSFRASASVFRGRSNLSNTDTTIRQGDHVYDYIFCSVCEKQLAIIENECNERLVQLTDDLIKGNLPICKTKTGHKYIALKKPGKNIVTLFFYSIIWRQCIQQKLDFHSIFTTEDFQENLRDIIAKEIAKPLKEIEQSDDFKTYPDLIILTTYHKGDLTKSWINPNVTASNPELFFIGAFKALIFTTPKVTIDFPGRTALPNSILDNELIINNSAHGIVGIINESLWEKVDKQLMQHEVDRYLFVMTDKFAKTKGIPHTYAGKQLHETAQKFKVDYPDNYVMCMELALETLLK